MKRKRNRYHLKYPGKRILSVSVLAFLLVMLITSIITVNLYDQSRKNEILELTDKYISFQHELGEYTETGVKLLAGYEAYLKINESITRDQTEKFLEYLTKDDMQFIRNIGIIKDTTIIHNYPIKGNESSIGVDLATVEGQKQYILQVKNELIEIFQGPVDLVQGGTGYIIRLPLTDKNSNYWGQASIVLRADKINESIIESAKLKELDVLIYHKESEVVILGNPDIINDEPIKFVDNNVDNWIVYVRPIDGWASRQLSTLLMFIIGVIVGGIISISLHFLQKAHYELKYVMVHDQLTGLYNRHYLEKIQKLLTDEAKSTNSHYGMLHMDLDNFKDVNDEYGHVAGDYVLRSIGKILVDITRSEDLVFRVGGDEFLILMPFISNKEGMKKAKLRLHKNFDNEFKKYDYLQKVVPSIGTSLYPEDGGTFDKVLRAADMEMYQEKRIHKHK